jgi:hypothetical protein
MRNLAYIHAAYNIYSISDIFMSNAVNSAVNI